MILVFNLELLPRQDHNLIATKEFVLETSHDFNLSLYLGIAPRARSWLIYILCDISFVALIFSLIIFEQRAFSSVLPPLTEKAPLFVFSPPTMLNA